MGEFRDTRALAVLSLRTTADGGIRHAWPASTPSFLFLFEGVQFGAFIFTADAEPLEPGDVERDVELLFWVPSSATMRNLVRSSPWSTATGSSAMARSSSSKRATRCRTTSLHQAQLLEHAQQGIDSPQDRCNPSHRHRRVPSWPTGALRISLVALPVRSHAVGETPWFLGVLDGTEWSRRGRWTER